MTDVVRPVTLLTAVLTGIIGADFAPAPILAQSALEWDTATTAAFDDLPTVSVATDATWPPMEYINRDGELVGFDIDLE
jgi:ABC-type amino acid transport substrate-binding protein